MVVTWSPWVAWYGTWLLIKLTPKGVVFSFLSFLTVGQQDVHRMLDSCYGIISFKAYRDK